MVALVAGMTFHLNVQPTVESLQVEIDLLLLGVAYDFLVAVDAVLDAHIVRDVLAKTGERDDVGVSVLRPGVNGVSEFLYTHIVILWVIHSLLNPVAAENSSDETVLAEGGPKLLKILFQFSTGVAELMKKDCFEPTGWGMTTLSPTITMLTTGEQSHHKMTRSLSE